MVRLCADVPHASIVEIGAGDGALLKRLQDDAFAEVACAVEISEAAAELVRARGIGGLAEVRVYDGGTLPYPDARFDLAILSHVVEHVEHPRRVLREASRVARHVFVEVPLEDTWRKRGNFRADPTGHINFYSPKTIRWLVQTSGLRVVRQVVVNPPRANYRHQVGRWGAIDHALKGALLALLPGLAPYLTWKYHCAMLCAPAPAPQKA